MAGEEKLRPDGRRHHYVPRLLLKRFSTERKKGKFQTFLFDKSTGKTFKTSVEKAMLEQDFNAFERDSYRFTLEPAMGRIESEAAPIFDKIIEQQSLSGLAETEHQIVCVFAALQTLRGPNLRNSFLDLAEGLRDRLSDEDISPEVAEFIRTPDTEEQKIFAMKMLADTLAEITAQFAMKDLILARTALDCPFILGDTPIVMMNDEDHAPYGNIGLAVPGIQIHLPISPVLSLVFWCPTIREKIVASWAEVEAKIAKNKVVANIVRNEIRAKILAEIEDIERSRRHSAEMLNAIQERAPLDVQEGHVKRLNSLQIAFSQRWLVGVSDSFDLAREMIADDPKFKIRQKPRFS